MNTGQVVLLVGLATCLVSDGLALTLPGILSSFTSSRRADESEAGKDQELKEQQDKHPTTTHRPTRPPLIPAIPHPADTPLNPYINPNHPLNPDNLPSLHLPSFHHFTRETIRATKTVFVELTERLTIHPVCMTAYRVTPPCLPFDPHHQPYHHHQKDQKDRLEDNLQAASVITPTAVIELEPTRIIDGASATESATEFAVEENERVEIPVVEPSSEDARRGRYMELTPSIAPVEKVEIKDAPEQHQQQHGQGGAGSHSTSPLQAVQNLLHHPVTAYHTKTLLVTKVEKVLDTRVTATLLAENCIPSNTHIPVCAPHGGLVGPGYHGYHENGIYSETFGGHIVGGLYTEKGPGYHPEGDVHEQVQRNKEDEQQEKEGESDDIESENIDDED